MATPKIIPRVNGGGSLGAATYGWGAGFITDVTATSSTQGGSLTLAANDGAAAIGSGHRLGVIEFKGEEDASDTLTTGARIQSIASEVWSGSANHSYLSFLTSYSNAQIGENVRIGGLTAMNVYYDYETETFENQLNDNEGGGDILKQGGGQAGAVGTLHFLHTDGTWDATDADAVATGGSQLLGIALGAEIGMLIKGFYRIASTNIEGTAVIGAPLYVSESPGKFDATAPSASGDFVRILGYCIDYHTDGDGDVLIYFNPDSTFVEIT